MKTFFVVVVMLAGCYGAHRNEQSNGDDAPPVCGDVTCDEQPASTCVDADTLRTFEATCSEGACSYPSTDVECGSSGCCGDHCCTITPSNAGDFGEIEPTGLVVAPPNGTFDTDAECTASASLGTCTPVTRANLPQACVCRADEITIGTLTVKGSRALVLIAKKKVVVQKLLDVSGDPGVPGPGATYAYDGQAHQQGGVGGSFATQGAGASGDNAVAAAYGEPTLMPLLGGMTGKGGGNANGGGGGGGALQITAGERVEVLGVINAGGGGGWYGYSTYGSAGGSGGGSGGAILIEAPSVIVTGTAVANGGAGGGGGGTSGSGGTGWDAGQTGIPVDPMNAAWGGSGYDGAGCPLYGYVSGGDGGSGALGTTDPGYGGYSDYDSRCIGNAAFVGGGGGGGGVGRIRINTTSGCQCGGKISPAATFGMLVKQ